MGQAPHMAQHQRLQTSTRLIVDLPSAHLEAPGAGEQLRERLLHGVIHQPCRMNCEEGGAAHAGAMAVNQRPPVILIGTPAGDAGEHELRAGRCLWHV